MVSILRSSACLAAFLLGSLPSGCGSWQAIPSSEIAQAGSSAATVHVNPKWALWTNGTLLRGANVYQQDERRAGTGRLFGPRFESTDFAALCSTRANYINFSVPGIFHVRGNPAWPEMVAHLDTFVTWAKAANLFVVISVRTGPGRGEGDITEDDPVKDRTVFDNTSQQAAWVEMWKQIATRYGAEKNVVGFDLMVEPHDVDRAKWRAFAQRMIDGIRSVDSNTPILVSPAGDWGAASALSGWEPLSGESIVYTVHQYEPYNFTHEDAPDYSRAELEAAYRMIRNWLSGHPGQRIVVNEFGANKDKPRAASFLADELLLLEQAGVNHAAWLWEVSNTADSSYAGDFDFKRSALAMAAFRDNWRLNTVFPSP